MSTEQNTENLNKFDNNNGKHRKKKFRFYDSYIPKILKQSFDNNGITSDARQQLNSILIIFSKQISNIANELTLIAKKKTISEKEIKSAVMVYLTGELQLHAITEGEKAVQEFSKNINNKGSSRQTKAGIIFPPSVVEKFLRKFDTSLIMVTHGAPIFLAAVLEYICLEIIELSALLAKEEKRIRITVSDLESSIKSDAELSKLVLNNNIKFLGGSVEQYIHPNLITKKSGKQVKRVIRNNNNEEKIIKYKAGSIAIKDIKKYQRMGNTLMFAKQPFEKFIRHIISEYKSNVKISKVVFSIIQYVLEDYLVNFLISANAAAIHAGRVKLMATDIDFIHCQRQGKRYNLNENNRINNLLPLLNVNKDNLNDEEIEEFEEESEVEIIDDAEELDVNNENNIEDEIEEVVSDRKKNHFFHSASINQDIKTINLNDIDDELEDEKVVRFSNLHNVPEEHEIVV